MKKVLLALGTLLVVSSFSFSAEIASPVASTTAVAAVTSSNDSTETESPESVESVTSETGHGISKGDSFMAAFGMGDAVAGGEAGMSSTAGAAGIAGSVANVGASSLTSGQNTPYVYK